MATTVMIVDDSLFMRKMLRDIIEAEGYVVTAEATNGEEAVQRFREARPDLTTMDIVMPGKNGIEALQEIRALDPSACVVMCTAVGEETFAAAAEQGGARGFILKPFSRDTVARVLKEAAQG